MPDSWANVPGGRPVDEWGNFLGIEIDKRQVKDLPDVLLQGRELSAPPEQMVWMIVVASMGPDEQPNTEDDLRYWRINGADDGQFVDHGFAYDEERWPSLWP